MNASDKQKIQSILNVFETGSAEGDYSNISIYNDGPGGKRQITYGRSQTTQCGNLGTLLKMYGEAGGQFSAQLGAYAGRMNEATLVNNTAFRDLLKKAGADPVMRKTQDEFFDKVYWTPAETWFTLNGFTKTLSMLVIFDSYIHSGSILSFLRSRFPAKVPAAGGKEEDWIEQYVDTRHHWLATHSTKILRKTIYRTSFFKEQLSRKNWDLKCPLKPNGVKVC